MQCVIQDPSVLLSTGRDSRRPDRSASRRFGGNPWGGRRV